MIRKVFFWCRGQDDNIGDVLLRRRMMRDLREMGEVHVLIGGASNGFVESMNFTHADVLYRNPRSWLTQLYRVALSEKMALAFNPGEVRVGPKSALSHSLLVPAQILGKPRGSKSIRAGIAVRGHHSFWSLPLRASDRLSEVVIRRNVERERFPYEYGPDWAFDEGGTLLHSDETRDKLLLTFRCDRPELPAESIAALRAIAERERLDLVVFTQVRRDNERGAELAARLDCDYVPWPDEVTHAEQEAHVRTLLRSARAVASDRIHALIMGTTEGALPIGLVTTEDSKVESHFAAAGFDNVSVGCQGLGQEAVEDFIAGVLHRSDELREVIELSRVGVARMGSKVRAGNVQ